MKCDNCRFIWTYPADHTSPYGEYCCSKGHWDAGPDGAHNMPDDPELGNIDPWEDCPDYEIKPPRRNRDNKP